MNLKQKYETLVINSDQVTVKARITNSIDNPKDCLDVDTRKSDKTKSSYDVFSLHLLLDTKHVILNNLFQRQLNLLIATYGENTENWINLPVEITGEQNGKYYNAIIKPTKEFQEEYLIEKVVSGKQYITSTEDLK